MKIHFKSYLHPRPENNIRMSRGRVYIPLRSFLFIISNFANEKQVSVNITNTKIVTYVRQNRDVGDRM